MVELKAKPVAHPRQFFRQNLEHHLVLEERSPVRRPAIGGLR